MGQNLIELYYNFAKFNNAVFKNKKIEASKPDDIKCLEITKTEKMVKLDEHFGRGIFWDEIEQTLLSEERTYFDEL